MSGTIFTASIIAIISSILSIITIEGLSNILFAIICPMVFLVKIVLYLFFRDEYDEIINNFYWICMIVIAILANIIFKVANWGGSLKTTFATLLILLIFFVVDKIVSKIKDDELLEFNQNIEWLDLLTGLFDIDCYISSISKIFITTILIIVSGLLLKTCVIGTYFINNNLCNKYNICILKNSYSKNQQTIPRNDNYNSQ